MHELAICQALLSQVGEIAERIDATRVNRITLRVGPLSGVVPQLLERTFEVARRGTVAADATLITETMPPRIRCRSCGREATVPPNRLVCPACGDYRTALLSGDELILARVEVETDITGAADTAESATMAKEFQNV